MPLALDAPQGTPLCGRRRLVGALAPHPLRGRRTMEGRGEEDDAKANPARPQ
jgi:hypothetical protein